VLNHVGGPVAIGPYAGKRDEAFAAWRAKIQEVASFPNTYVKLGGLGMKMIGFDFFEKPEPPSSQDLEAALSEEPRPGADRKLSGKEEALLVATACSSPPKGRARWTLELLSGSPSTTTSLAKPCAGAWLKTNSSPGARTCGAYRRSTASSSPAWKMCSTSMLRNLIGSGR
jgi:hypothetical protein